MAHTAFGSQAKRFQSASAALLQPRDILAAHDAVRAGRACCLGAREVRAAWPCDCAPRAARACTMLLQAARGVCTMSGRELCTGNSRPRTEDWALGAPAAHRLPLPRAPRRLSALLRCVFAQGLAAGIWVPPAAVLAASPAVAPTIVHMLAAAVSAAALAASSAKALAAANLAAAPRCKDDPCDVKRLQRRFFVARAAAKRRARCGAARPSAARSAPVPRARAVRTCLSSPRTSPAMLGAAGRE